MYHSTKLKLMKLYNCNWAWSMNLSKYVPEAVRICKEYVAKHLSEGYRLPERLKNVLSMGYYQELDEFLQLGLDEAFYHQSLMRVIRWMVEIGHIDISTKMSLLSLVLAIPRQGHLESALHVMGHLKLKHNSQLAFNSTCLNINQSDFQEYNWTDFCEGAVEAIQPSAPLPRCKQVDLCMFLDINHAGNNQTQ